MHPELFELKALVAGRLDAHRRREIDDHLGSCADCSRHYVALMLGSSSPKTAEAEARQGHVPSSAGMLSFAGAGAATDALIYGIDAPLAAPIPRPMVTRPPHSNLAALETEFVAPVTRTPMPVSSSLVDAITKLRAESEQAQLAAAAAAATALERASPPPVSEAAPATVPPVPREASAPADVVSIIPSPQKPIAPKAHALPSFLQDEPPASAEAAPELVVTFSSTPTRFARRRIVTPAVAVDAVFDAPYVSRAVSQPVVAPAAAPVSAHAEMVVAADVAAAPALVDNAAFARADAVVSVTADVALPFDAGSDDALQEARVAQQPTSMKFVAMAAGAALALIVAGSGWRYFQSSVSQAASTAAAAAARQVEATAARTAAGVAATAAASAAAAPAPAPAVETRIVYVREPAKQESPKAVDAATAIPSIPIAVTLPDVNLQTSAAETGVNASSQRSATSELTRSARATAARTANPRP